MAAAGVAEKPVKVADYWKPLTPIEMGLLALFVPERGTLVLHPSGQMCWLPGIMHTINERDPQGGQKLLRISGWHGLG